MTGNIQDTVYITSSPFKQTNEARLPGSFEAPLQDTPDPTPFPGKLTRKQKKKQKSSAAKRPSNKTKTATTEQLQAQLQDLTKKSNDASESEKQPFPLPDFTKTKKHHSAPIFYKDIDDLKTRKFMCPSLNDV